MSSGPIGITPSTSASPRPAKARTAASKAPSASVRSSATDSATPSASRSPRIQPREIPVCHQLLAAGPRPHRPGPAGAPEPAEPPFDFFTYTAGPPRNRARPPSIQLRRPANRPRRRHPRHLRQGRPKLRPNDDVRPEAVYEDLNLSRSIPPQPFESLRNPARHRARRPPSGHRRLPPARRPAQELGRPNPILLKDCLDLRPRCRSTRIPPCCAPPRSSARCWPTASATPSWCAANPGPVQACAWPTTSCKPPDAGASRPITWPAPAAAAPCSTSKPSPPGSSPAPNTSRASKSPSWAASSTARARWLMPISATSAARQARSTSTSAKPPSNSTSPKPRPSIASSTSSATTASGYHQHPLALRCPSVPP
jgi:hypothetical protein